jgi:hypothetical protein
MKQDLTQGAVAAAVQANIDPAYHRVMARRTTQPTQAALDVLAERKRQIDGEGTVAEMDDQYTSRELAAAAVCYIEAASYPAGMKPTGWPWAAEWWKPTDYRRNLVKAGALLLAEIERLDRAAPPAMTREAWNQAYAAHMAEQGGLSLADGLALAGSTDDFFNDDCSPVDAADEEMSCWGD